MSVFRVRLPSDDYDNSLRYGLMCTRMCWQIGRNIPYGVRLAAPVPAGSVPRSKYEVSSLSFQGLLPGRTFLPGTIG